MSEKDVRAMVAFYSAGLQDLDKEVVEAAIIRLAATAKFIPTIAEIREAVGVVHHGEVSPAAMAWGEIHGFIRNKGSWKRPGVDFVISDPISREIVKAMGWEDICASTNPDALSSRFMHAYTEMSKAARKEAALSPGGKNHALPASKSRARIEREGQARTLGLLVGVVNPVVDIGE